MPNVYRLLDLTKGWTFPRPSIWISSLYVLVNSNIMVLCGCTVCSHKLRSNLTFPQIPQPVNFCHCCLYISDNERKELKYINLQQVSLLYRQCVIGKRVSCNTDLLSWHCFLWLKKIAQTHTPIFHCPWLEVADAMSKDKQHQQKVTPPFFFCPVECNLDLGSLQVAG